MKKLLLSLCALLSFIACNQETIEEQSAICADVPETITVGFEGDQTRIQLNEEQKTVWTKGDLASVFYRSDANQKWQYQGETGERIGDLKRVKNATGTTKTTKTVVVYPYSENYWLNTDSYAIEASLPATQYYTEGSYGVGSNLMVSQSEFTQFSLKSVCGWLKLQLIGNGEVIKSIKFRGNNNEQVAGLIYVDTETANATLASEMGSSDDNNAGGNLIFDDTILTELTLDCGEGVSLSTEATAFYISLPPQTVESGFTVEIESEGNKPLTLTTSNALVIERNTIQPMASVEPAFAKILPQPANNEVFYTTTDGNIISISTSYLQSNTYTDGRGVLLFSQNITYIFANLFKSKNTLESIIFPDSVTEIGISSFSGCLGLKSVVIGKGIKYIDENAFNNCSALVEIYCKATTPPSLDNVAALGGAYGKQKIYVPTASVDAYKKASNWSSYASKIVGYDF